MNKMQSDNNTKNSEIIFAKPIDKNEVVCYNIQVISARECDDSAGVAELADARDLKSRDTRVSYRFETGHRHHTKI